MSLDRITIAGWERDRFHRATADAIAALPETSEPELQERHAASDTAVVLLEREYAGLRVTVDWLPVCGVTLTVTEGEKPPVAVEIDPAKALDAFAHPYCYLPA